MGLKTKIIIIVAILLILQGLTGGMLFSALLPKYDFIVGKALCTLGGFIVQPVADLGFMKLPLPTQDDIAFSLIITTFLGVVWFRKFESKWRKVIAVAISLPLFIYVYKSFGLVMMWIAEYYFGMSNCAQHIDLGIVKIEFSWLAPLFYVLLFFSIVSFIIGAYKIFKKEGA